ncbi:unnamed protein product [Albugo candida]|uniref:Pantoate--beta-alanine ligase n=1 Tax=Albugo candida TaxID=65357 RepID=A0A024GBL6_9STRA|nr:unnamed protein product [Albugo candida]|eukprot:CCI43890.1 unnamed protein product [Albugo candida]
MSRSRLQLLETIQSFRKARQSLPPISTLGFIPTMGGLHKGHLHLIQNARSQCDQIVVSIFVNPLQFGPNEDFHRYPRSLEADLTLLEAEDVDFVFAPSTTEMISASNSFAFQLAHFQSLPEAQMRPGHFEGVASILIKLFNVVQPTHAFFGQKDAAQCVLVRQLIDNFHFNITPQFLPISREPNGLARSTRNRYLTETERRKASVLFRGLTCAENAFKATHSIASETLEMILRKEFATESLLTEIEYISIANRNTMTPIERVDADGAIISIAVQFANCRLIDAIFLE